MESEEPARSGVPQEHTQHLGILTVEFDASGKILASYGSHVRRVGASSYHDEHVSGFSFKAETTPVAEAVAWYAPYLSEAEERDHVVTDVHLRVRATPEEVREALERRFGGSAIKDLSVEAPR